MKIARQVFYKGNVQGVGFRYNALRCSKGLSIYGFVRNLPDGRVELIAEGERNEVLMLLERITQTRAENIAQQEVRDVSVANRSPFAIQDDET